MVLDRLQRPVRGVRIVRRDPDAESPFRVQIVPLRTLTVREVQRLKRQLDSAPEPIVTSALTTIDQQPFLDEGFAVRETLHLLRHDLSENATTPAPGPAILRKGRRSDLSRVLEIDRLSFDTFWSLDRDGLTTARRATPIHRYLVAEIEGIVVGYIVSGRAGNTAFLQRLGVHPDHRGSAIGSQLIRDALAWAKQSLAASMLVNTQVSNTRAVEVYLSHGFELEPQKLQVLEWVR